MVKIKVKIFKEKREVEIFQKLGVNADAMLNMEMEVSSIKEIFMNNRVRETIMDSSSYFMRMLVMASIVAEHTGDWTLISKIQDYLKDMNRELTLF